MLYHLAKYFFTVDPDLSYLRIFHYLSTRSMLAAFTAFSISLLLGKEVISQLQKLKLGQTIRNDGPQSHLQKAGTPTMGGVLILVSVLVPLLLWGDLANRLLLIVMLVMIWLGITGFIDDYLKIVRHNSDGLSPSLKLLSQATLGLGVGVYLYLYPPSVGILWGLELSGSDYIQHLNPSLVTQIEIPFVKDTLVDIGLFYIPLVVMILVATSNSVNITDGLDGLAIGCIIFSIITIGIFAYLVGNWRFAQYLRILFVDGAGELTVACAALVGSGLGFLWFNAHPAEVFMGDTGSLALGGALGIIGILIKKELLLLIVGGVFVIEAASVIIQVVVFKLKGRRVFKMAPLHHHFELQGIDENKVIVRFWIMAVIFMLLSLLSLKVR